MNNPTTKLLLVIVLWIFCLAQCLRLDFEKNKSSIYNPAPQEVSLQDSLQEAELTIRYNYYMNLVDSLKETVPVDSIIVQHLNQ